MGIKVGMVGIGTFAQNFIPLYKAHPMVDEVVLCDLNADKLKESARKYEITKTYSSLDDLCNTDVDAAVIITQNWLHAPQAIQALKAGKHVYSAVPAGISVQEIADLVKTVEETKKIYMIGETSYYYPAVIYCREKYKRGEFGHIVYSEAQYFHDWDHGMYEIYKRRAGEKWLEVAGSPPMHYSTHSTSEIVAVTGGKMTHVSCHGFVDKMDDRIYRHDTNKWGNVFSNETALFRMSDGSSCRINEFRRIGSAGQHMSIFGTEACFEQNNAGAVWMTKNAVDPEFRARLDHHLQCKDGVFTNVSAVHPVSDLPKQFKGKGLPNGHLGSHQFLVHEFVTACVENKIPPNNVWAAARYNVPGLVAHESAVQDGRLLEIPDFGEAPESW